MLSGQADAMITCFSEYPRKVLDKAKSRQPTIPEQMKQAEQHPDECYQTDADPKTDCMEFDIAKGRFSFRLTAPYSEEHRRVVSEAVKANASNLTRSVI